MSRCLLTGTRSGTGDAVDPSASLELLLHGVEARPGFISSGSSSRCLISVHPCVSPLSLLHPQTLAAPHTSGAELHAVRTEDMSHRVGDWGARDSLLVGHLYFA